MNNALQPNRLTASIYAALRLQYDHFAACVANAEKARKS